MQTENMVLSPADPISLSGEHYCKPVSSNVLLIEDNLGDVFLIKKVLLATEIKISKLRITHVESLAVGLQRLAEEQFDVILLDLGLPDSQGIDTLLRLREKAPYIPTVVLTDLDDDAVAAQLIQHGAQAYLVKRHISQSWLKSTINLAIAGSKKTEQQQQHSQALARSNQALQQQIDICKHELESLKEKLKHLSALVSNDGLTGITNRNGFEEYLEQAWINACLDQKPISLIMIDLDYFKQFNDSRGHLQGDVCLQQVARNFDECLTRSQDMIARYGGEEFVAVLPDTSVQDAVEIAKKLGAGISSLAIRHPNSAISRWVTASFGVATVIPQSDDSSSSLLYKADKALYIAKENGRDRIAYFQAPSFVVQSISQHQQFCTMPAPKSAILRTPSSRKQLSL